MGESGGKETENRWRRRGRGGQRGNGVDVDVACNFKFAQRTRGSDFQGGTHFTQ